MRKITYLAIFEPGATGYSVYFPDLPGCVSCGSDYMEAQRMATEALELHIYGMEKDGDVLPVPSNSLDLAKIATTPNCLVSPITVFPGLVKNEMDNRAVRTNLTLPAWLKEMAEARGVNYSKVLQAALMEYLGVPEGPR